MKWFKHISDSLDDPFIFDLIDKFGGDGYLVFFGVIEIYAREFKPELDWNLDITRAYLRQKLHKRQDTLIIKILKHIQDSGKWDVNLNSNNVTVFIPKFIEVMDNWTARKLRSGSVVTPKKHTPEVEVDKRIKKKNNIKRRLTPPSEQEVIDYFIKNGYKASAGKKAWKYYTAAKWKDSKGNQVKNWKQKMIGVWFKDENKDTVKITRGSKNACQAGPCQNPLSLINDKYCKECQIVLDEDGCKTYQEYIEKSHGDKNIQKLASGLFGKIK